MDTRERRSLEWARKVIMVRRVALMTALLAGAAASPSFAAGDAQAGHQLARQWCTGCHVVDDAAQGGSDTAPSFASIAHRRANDQTWLRGWLTSPHPPMPNLNLSRQQIDDVMAYLGTLAPR